MLFAADTPWSWDAEKKFKELRDQMTGADGEIKVPVDDPEAKDSSIPAHVEAISGHGG